MENQKNPEFKTPNPIRIDAHRSSPTVRPPPSPLSQLTKPQPPFPSNSGFSTARQPVPTGKIRTAMADKIEQIIANQPISLNTTNVQISPLNLPVTKETGENQKEKNNSATNKTKEPHAPVQRANSFDSLISMKHRLPVAPAPNKARYRIQRKKINNSTNTQVPSTLHATSQTDKIFIVSEEELGTLQMIKSSNISEEDFEILEIVKNSVAKKEILTWIDLLNKQKESKDDDACVIIDSESNSEESRENSEVKKKCSEHSDNNKSLLLAAMEAIKHSQNIEFPIFSTTPIPEKHSAATSDQPPISKINAETPSRPVAPFPKNIRSIDEIMKPLHHLALLRKAGIRLTSNNLERTQTMESHNQWIQTEDENDKKKRKTSTDGHPVEIVVNVNSFQQAPLITGPSQNLRQTVHVPQEAKLTMFQQREFQPTRMLRPQVGPPQMHRSQLQQPQMQMPQYQQRQMQTPRPQQTQLQLQQAQIPPYVTREQREEPMQYYTGNLNNTTQKRTHLSAMRNQDQFPFDQNRAGTSRPQMQLNRSFLAPQPTPTPPVRAPMQLSPNDPMSQFLQSQLAPAKYTPRMIRVLSTREANETMQGSGDFSHPDDNWSFPDFYNRQDNNWSPRSQ